MVKILCFTFYDAPPQGACHHPPVLEENIVLMQKEMEVNPNRIGKTCHLAQATYVSGKLLNY